MKNSRATSVRILARSAAGTAQSAGSPAAWFKAAIRFATSTRNGDVRLVDLERRPSRVTAW